MVSVWEGEGGTGRVVSAGLSPLLIESVDICNILTSCQWRFIVQCINIDSGLPGLFSH